MHDTPDDAITIEGINQYLLTIHEAHRAICRELGLDMDYTTMRNTMLNGTLDYQASDECPRLRDYEDRQAFNTEQNECLHTPDYWTDPTPSALAFKDMVGDTTDYALYDDPF